MTDIEREEIFKLLDEINNTALEYRYGHIKNKSIKNFRKWINNKGFYIYGMGGIKVFGLGLFQIQFNKRNPMPMKSVYQYIEEGKNFQAVRAYRAWANYSNHVGLSDAKKAVKRITDEMRIS